MKQNIKTILSKNHKALDIAVNQFCQDYNVFAIQTDMVLTSAEPFGLIHKAVLFYYVK